MLPLSSKDPLPYRPREDGPTWLIKPATRLERIAFDRAMRAAGARFPTMPEMFATLRAGIRATADEAEQEMLLAVVDGAETVLLAGEALEGAAKTNFDEIERVIRGAYAPYAALEGDRVHFIEMKPVVAARLFLVGAEGEKPLPRDKKGQVDEAALEALSDADLFAIGYEALRLMEVSADAAKNSVSGSPSASSPTASTTSPETMGTEAAGLSSATPTT